MDDVRAVMDAVGSRHAVLLGVSEGGPMCSLFAATYPGQTEALVMIGTYARRLRAPDYPWAPDARSSAKRFFKEIVEHWGGPVGIDERAPSVAHDPAFREWWAAYLRMGASPGGGDRADADERRNRRPAHVLPTIRVPTLVLHRTGDRCLLVEEGRYVAEPDSRRAVRRAAGRRSPAVRRRPGRDARRDRALPGQRAHEADADRVLATLLCGEAGRRPQGRAPRHDVRARSPAARSWSIMLRVSAAAPCVCPTSASSWSSTVRPAPSLRLRDRREARRGDCTRRRLGLHTG